MSCKGRKNIPMDNKMLLEMQSASRDDIGSFFCAGEGLEIGAGSRPTKVSPGAIIHYADKRTPDELKTYFASDDIVNVESLSSFSGRKFDFVIAHHVLEHSANVIQTLIDWIFLLKNGGTLYISLPNRHITPDAARLLTPPTHFLLDYIYQATEDDYESREHICSFLWGWIDVGGLQGKTKLESAECVASALNSETNDLHWHTFNIDTFNFVVNMAAILSGYTMELLLSQDGFNNQDEHRLVCKMTKNSGKKPKEIMDLLDIHKRLRNVINDVALENMEGKATYALSKGNKGKIFAIEKGKMRWIRSPRTLDERGLNGVDYTYFEISGAQQNLIGKDITDYLPDRRLAIIERLHGKEKDIGIELSPGAIPIIEKSKFNVVYVDKFDHAINADSYLQGKPVSIDFLLGGKLLDEVLEHNKYGFLVSSHVIEHIPDFIQFFKSAATILENGARLVMYVPDKRYTFDVLRKPSSIKDIEQAHRLRLRHPSRSMAKDVYINSDFKADAEKLWGKSYTPMPSYEYHQALTISKGMELESADLHCFTFTPESFKTLINHVIEEYIPDFEVLEITETGYGQNEFIVDLILKK